ncbi:MAG: malonyl-CoA decarboxylase [Gammaproteobacteria bacterium]|nr:malonyl-CoA decarboxylase [Gammaproteobacteria bacterium]
MNSVAESGLELLRKQRLNNKPTLSINELCQSLLRNKGEALGTALASEIVTAYMLLTDDDKLSFFQMLLQKYTPDPEQISLLSKEYLEQKSRNAFHKLSQAVESPRQKLFRQINMAPTGTQTVVNIRHDLLKILNDYPELKMIDDDLVHLLSSWFSPGFLELKQIDWNTSALILEKLIAYEAVHEMKGWEDLRRRLDDDRRCFAFFHPALPDEPIIFVEVALVKGISDSIQNILAKNEMESVEKFDTAIFYSISNCQTGLKGINFGNFLIKQVVMQLENEMSQIKNYATLSPIPGFRNWVKSQIEKNELQILSPEESTLLKLLDNEDWFLDEEITASCQPLLLKLCANYLYHSKQDNKPCDPVARFHLSNGASILRLNWLGDVSAKGMHQSYGILVNYHYDLETVTENHESFVNDGSITISKNVMKLVN